ncbi:TolB family protein [Virgibacillus ainsalahensis]
MKRNRILKVSIAIVMLLFLSLLTYGILRDDDPYKDFTGIGEGISVSPDDQDIVFSYYVDGDEAIYTANVDGTNVKKIAGSEDQRLHHPRFSSDGEQLLYLAKDAEGINSLFAMNSNGNDRVQLTDADSHVVDAVFSPSAETVYFIGMEAEEFKKSEGETKEGFDLFSIAANGENTVQLTDKDHFSMNSLSASSDGEQLFYSEFDGNGEVIRSFSLENNKVESTMIPTGLSSSYSSQLSPDGEKMAFTAVSEESRDSSLFEYELFLMDTNNRESQRLTDLNAAVDSPSFFHHQDKILFLENTSWPSDPAQYRMRTINFDGNDLATVDLDVPEAQGGSDFTKLLDQVVNSYTIATLYILLLGLVTMFLHFNKKKTYLPSIVSLSVAVIVFISSFVVAGLGNPWAGIGIGMLAAALFICSLIVLVFAFILKRMF